MPQSVERSPDSMQIGEDFVGRSLSWLVRLLGFDSAVLVIMMQKPIRILRSIIGDAPQDERQIMKHRQPIPTRAHELPSFQHDQHLLTFITNIDNPKNKEAKSSPKHAKDSDRATCWAPKCTQNI